MDRPSWYFRTVPRQPLDPAWAKFAQTLRDLLNGPPRITSSTLAAGLGVDVETVDNWRRGRSRPQLAQLPQVMEVVAQNRPNDLRAQERFYLLQAMGVVPQRLNDEELFDRAFRLRRLEEKLTEVRMQAVGNGAACVVQAAVMSGEWMVGVVPLFEGPLNCRIHTGDRLDIRRIAEPNLPVPHDEVWRDPKMKSALRASNAFPSFALAPTFPRTSDDQQDGMWAIAHTGVSKGPQVPDAWPDVRTICVFGITYSSGVHEVGDFLSIALGYGLITTRELAMETFGMPATMTRTDQRAAAHGWLCRQPPWRRVWCHYGLDGDLNSSPLQKVLGKRRESVGVVWLREDDQLIRHDHKRRPGDASSAGEAAEYRDWLDTRHKRSDGIDPLVVDVNYIEDRNERWVQALETSMQVLVRLRDLGFPSSSELPRLEAIHSQVSAIDPQASTILSWFRSKGWPR